MSQKRIPASNASATCASTFARWILRKLQISINQRKTLVDTADPSSGSKPATR